MGRDAIGPEEARYPSVGECDGGEARVSSNKVKEDTDPALLLPSSESAPNSVFSPKLSQRIMKNYANACPGLSGQGRLIAKTLPGLFNQSPSGCTCPNVAVTVACHIHRLQCHVTLTEGLDTPD